MPTFSHFLVCSQAGSRENEGHAAVADTAHNFPENRTDSSTCARKQTEAQKDTRDLEGDRRGQVIITSSSSSSRNNEEFLKEELLQPLLALNSRPSRELEIVHLGKRKKEESGRKGARAPSFREKVCRYPVPCPFVLGYDVRRIGLRSWARTLVALRLLLIRRRRQWAWIKSTGWSDKHPPC